MIKAIKSKLNQKGFSLIELMVVIVIMLILAAIAIPAFMNVVKDANEAAAKSEARTVVMLAQLEVDKYTYTASTMDFTDPTGGANGSGSEDSVFELAGISDDDQGCYTSIAITDGQVTFTYDNGAGIAFTMPNAEDL